MRINSYNQKFKFCVPPVNFNKNSDPSLLKYCLGATLYMPGHQDILAKIQKHQYREFASIVMCLEDSIKEEDLPRSEQNILDLFNALAEQIENGSLSIDDIPLIFIRVRNVQHFQVFAQRLTSRHLSILSGFTFPKFSSQNAWRYFGILESLIERSGANLYAMPILEGEEIAFRESRDQELLMIKNVIDAHRDIVLNIRVGGTDFSSLFGVRRDIFYSIYDISPVSDCLLSIVNYFLRTKDDYVISAPVWEYFRAYKQDDINHIQDKNLHTVLMDRSSIVNDAIDGLLREVILDKANGFMGKTIIHPSHARFVNALQVVTLEEYEDAKQILDTSGGVVKSSKGNKMNEIGPHRSWANKVLRRAQAYGVVENYNSILELISEKA